LYSCSFCFGDHERNRAGDYISLNTYSAPQGLTRLEATIVEVQTGVKGRSSLRIQIGKGEALDGHELSVEARIVAVVSPSKVAERWETSPIVIDRFPRAPESDQRQPGERTLSEDPPHVSPVDSLSNFPVLQPIVCSEKVKQPATNTCTDLRAARGSFGFHALQLEAGSTPAESILSSKKEMSFHAGTLLVLELNSISRIR
jgi:hypothetical protein